MTGKHNTTQASDSKNWREKKNSNENKDAPEPTFARPLFDYVL